MWGIAAQLRCSKSPPLESLVPPKVPWQSQVPSSSTLLVRSCCSNKAPRACPHCHHTSPGRKSITPTPCAQAQHPSLCQSQCSPHTHTQRKIRLGLLHILCDSATAAETLPTTWDLPSCTFFRHLHARFRMGKEVPITMLSTTRQATEVFQKRLPFETRIKASKQFQLILSSLCMFVFTSTCAQGSVKPPLPQKRKKTNPPRSTGNQ